MKAAYLKGGDIILVNGERCVVRSFDYTNKDAGNIRLRGREPLYRHWDDEVEVVGRMQITWLAVRGPGVDRMTTWIGATKRYWVTELTREFVENVPMTFELPPGSELHTTKPDGESYEFTVFKEPA